MKGERVAIAPLDVFERTMSALEAGLLVRDIATFEISTCDCEEPAESVFSRPELEGYDFVPVRNEARVVGVLERPACLQGKSAAACMRALDDSVLVSAEEPLKRFLPLLCDAEYRLVVRGTSIEGIVTRGDVHKLPVRLLAFALVTHLETTMADVIARQSPDDAWLGLLSPARRQKVEEKLAVLRARHLDPPLVELTEFADKRDLLAKQGHLGRGKERERATKDLRDVEDLRNVVAHAATYAQSEPGLREFLRVLDLTERHIGALCSISWPET